MNARAIVVCTTQDLIELLRGEGSTLRLTKPSLTKPGSTLYMQKPPLLEKVRGAPSNEGRGARREARGAGREGAARADRSLAEDEGRGGVRVGRGE